MQFTQFYVEGNNSVAHLLHVEEIQILTINSEKRFIRHWYLSDVTESSRIKTKRNKSGLVNHNRFGRSVPTCSPAPVTTPSAKICFSAFSTSHFLQAQTLTAQSISSVGDTYQRVLLSFC